MQILVEVNRDGTVKQISLKKSSGFVLLDDAAMNAVKHWEFLPANKNGLQIESEVEVPVRFKLASGGPSEISITD